MGGKSNGFAIGNILTHKEAAAFYDEYFREGLKNFDPRNPLPIAELLEDATYTPEVLDVQHMLPSYEALIARQLGHIKTISPCFNLLSEQKKQEHLRTLRFAIYLYYLQYQLDAKKVQRTIDIAKYEAGISDCLNLILKLEHDYTTPEAPDVAASSKPLQYLAIDAARWMCDQIYAMASNQYREFSVGKTKKIKGWMGDLNLERLEWVWGKMFLVSILTAFTKKIIPSIIDIHGADAKKIIDKSSVYTGYLSFVLYYARDLIHIGLLLRNTLVGPMFEREVLTLDELPSEEEIAENYRFKYLWITTDTKEEESGISDEEANDENTPIKKKIPQRVLYYVRGNGDCEELKLSEEDKVKLAALFAENEIRAKLTAEQINDLHIVNKDGSAHSPWTIAETKEMQPWERFKTQWKLRKFSILNDTIWGLANMACFYWLIDGNLLLAGNGLTGALLIMDLSLAVLYLYEESTQHNKLVLEMEEKITTLTNELEDFKASLATLEEEKEQKKEIGEKISQQLLDEEAQLRKRIADHGHQLAVEEEALKQVQFEWLYHKYKLWNLVGYSAGLLLAFSIANTFYLPAPWVATGLGAIGISATPALMLGIGIGGAGLCFIFTTLNAAINGSIDIAKSRASAAELKAEYQEVFDKFKKVNQKLSRDDLDDEKRQKLEEKRRDLYLQLKGIEIEIGYHSAMAKYHAANMVRSMMIDAMVPFVAFAALALMPTFGTGLAVIAAALLVVLISKQLIKQFEPTNDKQVTYDEEHFQTFCAEPVNPFEKGPTTQNNTFFGNSEKEQPAETPSPTSSDGEEEGMKGNLKMGPITSSEAG